MRKASPFGAGLLLACLLCCGCDKPAATAKKSAKPVVTDPSRISPVVEEIERRPPRVTSSLGKPGEGNSDLGGPIVARGILGSGQGLSLPTSEAALLADSDALARVADEIKTAVSVRPTLVVWLLDTSPSAENLVNSASIEIRSIYNKLIEQGLPKSTTPVPEGTERLLTSVIAFGETSQLLTVEPTAEAVDVLEALDNLPRDKSGKEMTFAAIGTAVDKYLAYRTDQRRELLLIVVTDEAGDDDQLAESLVTKLRRNLIPIHVIGVPAPLGRAAGVSPTIEGGAPDAADGPIRQGPESRRMEQLQLPTPGGGFRAELIDSGFGPFALSRLCEATGGKFHALRPQSARGQWPAGMVARFDPKVMRRYAPDYVSDEAYERILQENAACAALVEAAQLPSPGVLQSPPMTFPKRNEAQLSRLLSDAQKIAAALEPEVDKLYETLNRGSSARDQLRSPRWQASYDLALGRAMAAKARVDGYSALLAEVKSGKEFTNPGSNTWVLQTAAMTTSNSQLERLCTKSQELLNQVISQHPGTPWAYLAEKELKSSMGWKWSEQ